MRLSMRPLTFFLFLLIGCAGIHANVKGEATNASAVAEDYPIKPVRLIEPFGAGGGPDLLAHALAQQLSQLWGQTVTVENIPGAGATAGPAQVAKSPPDGYTLLINTNAQAYSAAFSKNLPYDPLKDFISIAQSASASDVLRAAAGIQGVLDLGEPFFSLVGVTPVRLAVLSDPSALDSDITSLRSVADTLGGCGN